MLDTSQQTLYSFYVKNNSSNQSIIVKLQVSPTTTDAYFVDDSSGTITVNKSGTSPDKAVLVPKTYLKYTRLWFNGNNPNIEAYYPKTNVQETCIL